MIQKQNIHIIPSYLLVMKMYKIHIVSDYESKNFVREYKMIG